MIRFFSCCKCHKEFSIVGDEMKRECVYCGSDALLFLRSSERVRKSKDYTKQSDTLQPGDMEEL
jgi:DNA-directed RNA polymerase subunit RPC12/RpoP